MSLEILNNPFNTTVQDLGRLGFMHIGISNSGASDEFLYLLVNKLLQNDKNAAILEISMGSIEFKFYKKTKAVVCGYINNIFLNDKEIEPFKVFRVKKDDILKIKNIPMGKKIYFGLKNGFNTQKILGSSSSSFKEFLGVFNGRRIKRGDILDYDEHESSHIRKYNGKFTTNVDYDILTLRVVLSYQEDKFSNEEKNSFFSQIFTITNDFNTMACRLDCNEPIVSFVDGVISEGISFGAIQIPKNGKPIILLKNRQTIGGYPKIGSVLGIDCFKLSQAAPNQKVRFEEITLEKAQKITKEFYSQFC